MVKMELKTTGLKKEHFNVGRGAGQITALSSPIMCMKFRVKIGPSTKSQPFRESSVPTSL